MIEPLFPQMQEQYFQSDSTYPIAFVYLSFSLITTGIYLKYILRKCDK